MELDKELPTLEELLKRRGVLKSRDSDDYQDYIESQERSVRPQLLGISGVYPEGSMHLALRRVVPSLPIKR